MATSNNERLLEDIEKKLYQVEGLLSTPVIQKEFKENDIDVVAHLKTIETYLAKFDVLKKAKKSLLEIVKEHLDYVISDIEEISYSPDTFKTKFFFLKKHEETFFGKNTSDNKTVYIDKKYIKDLAKIKVQNFFSIKEINLNLKDKKEIYIVGANGDGKTLLLQAIVVGLKGTQEDGLKEFRARESEFKIDIAYKEDVQNSFFAYGASRNNVCLLEEDSTGYLTLFSGKYDLKSPKNWLIGLYNAQNAKEHTIVSLEDAITLLQKMLERDITIEVTYNNVIFKEKGSEVSFEQLSAGYRGVIIIICDLIERLSKKQQVEKIKDFKGVVLIDEVELHLHPKWQYGFMTKLRETFPFIQFIVTTHSPTVLLGAGMEAVYYEIYKEDGEVKLSEQKEVENDFLNDIQTDIFGFDVNQERIDNPDMKRQQRAKEALLSLIKTIEEEQ